MTCRRRRGCWRGGGSGRDGGESRSMRDPVDTGLSGDEVQGHPISLGLMSR